MNYYLYCIKLQDSIIYIGVTKDIDVRFRRHYSSKTPLGQVLRESGDKACIKTLAIGSRGYIFDLEIRAIVIFGTRYPKGFNLAEGGPGGRNPLPSTRAKLSAASMGHKRLVGYVHSEATRAKMSESHMGHIVSEETRTKMGHVLSTKERAKISAVHTGKVVSEETRSKQSASAKIRHAKAQFPNCLHQSLVWNHFVAYHSKQLMLNEIEYGVILSVLQQNDIKPHYWHFGKPGACAIYVPGRAIILGNLTESQCRQLAEDTAALDYPGVMGSGLTTHWFANRASELGIHFHDVEPQQIYALNEPAKHPRVNGHWRHIGIDETDFFISWLIEFAKEANPFDHIPNHEEAAKVAADHRFIFWEVDRQVVSMAGTTRPLRTTKAITGVYTPPEFRGHGYAGAVTAVIADIIIAKGLIATLYTDLRVPASNRCYGRLGFQPACASFHYHR